MKKAENSPIVELIELDEKRRSRFLTKVESKKAEQNKVSKQIPIMKKNKEDTTAVFAEMKALSEDIKAMDEQVRGLTERFGKCC